MTGPSRPTLLILANKQPYRHGFNYACALSPLNRFQTIERSIFSKESFLREFADVGRTRGIDYLIVFPHHGWDEYILFDDGSKFTIADINGGLLNGYDAYFRRSKKSSCFLEACHTARPEKGSFAEILFHTLKINGEAPITAIRSLPRLGPDLRVATNYPKNYQITFDEEIAFRYFHNSS